MNRENLFDKLINDQIDDFSNFIVENHRDLDIYFFIGAGLLKYLSNKDNVKIVQKKYLLWSEMIKRNGYEHLNITNINDLLTINYGYENFINEINNLNDNKFNKEIINNKNKGLLDLFNTFNNIFRLNSKISNNKNSIKIITTNHCNTINHYFKIDECYDINETKEFLKSDLCILKLHQTNEKTFYSIDDYMSMYNEKNGYIHKLFSLSNQICKINKYKKKLIIIFGSRMEELHIITFLNKLTSKSKNNFILWIRDINSMILKDIKIYDYNFVFEELKKVYEDYKERNYHIIFYPKEKNNELFNIISEKIKILFVDNEEVSLNEKFVLTHPDYNKPFQSYKRDWIINEYLLQKQTRWCNEILNDLNNKADYLSIYWILIFLNNSLDEFKWFLNNNIEKNEYLSAEKILDLISSYYDYDLEDQNLKNNSYFPKFLFNKEILLLIWKKTIKKIEKYHEYFKAYMFLFENIDKSKITNTELKCFINYLLGKYKINDIYSNFNYKIRNQSSNNFKMNITDRIINILELNKINFFSEQHKEQIKYKLEYILCYLPNAFNLNTINKKIDEISPSINFLRIQKWDTSKIDHKFNKISNLIEVDIDESISLIQNLEKEFDDNNFKWLFYSKITLLYNRVVNLYSNYKISENDFINLSITINALINKYSDHNKDNKKYYYLLNENIRNLNLYKILNIIQILNEKNCNFLMNQIFILFTFNARLNPTFDYYYINSFSLISLICEMNKIKDIEIKQFLDNVFENNSSKKYIDTYCNVIIKDNKTEFEKFLWILFDIQNKKYEFKNYSNIITKDFLEENLIALNEIYFNDNEDNNINMFLFFISLALDALNEKIINFDFIIHNFLFKKEFIEIYKKYRIWYMIQWINIAIDESNINNIEDAFDLKFLENNKDLFKNYSEENHVYFKNIYNVQKHFKNKLTLNNEIKNELINFWEKDPFIVAYKESKNDNLKHDIISSWINKTIYICSIYNIKKINTVWDEKINNYLYDVQNNFNYKYIEDKVNELFDEILLKEQK